jgi:hypothetical protein
MRFNDGLGDGQVQPGAAQFTTAGWAGAVEAVKDVGQIFLAGTILLFCACIK